MGNSISTMESKSLYEQMKLLVFAEEETLQNNFVADLQGFLQDKTNKPKNDTDSGEGLTTSQVELCHIISSPTIEDTDDQKTILSKSQSLQEHFIEQLKLNAIILLMQTNPEHYERFLSLSLFVNFRDDDISKMEKNIIFVFVHNEPVSYEKTNKLDAKLWTVLNDTSSGLCHSKTFHYNSRMDEDFCKIFVQFICMNKNTLSVKTFDLHQYELKLSEYEDFLDLIVAVFFLNEDSIHFSAIGENKKYSFQARDDYLTICTNRKCLDFHYCCNCCWVETKYDLELCTILDNPSSCAKCNCPKIDHKAVKYAIHKNESVSNEPISILLKKYRHNILAIMVTIDLFIKKYYPSVTPCYDILKERITREPSYSIIETLYEYEMSGREIEVTVVDYMECILKLIITLDTSSLQCVKDKAFLLPERKLRVTF